MAICTGGMAWILQEIGRSGLMGKSVEQIIDIVTKLDPGMEITREAASAMTAIPGLFVKMAIKKTLKRARQEGVQVIDKAYTDKIKKENYP
jgi:hypothetical protein